MEPISAEELKEIFRVSHGSPTTRRTEQTSAEELKETFGITKDCSLFKTIREAFASIQEKPSKMKDCNHVYGCDTDDMFERLKTYSKEELGDIIAASCSIPKYLVYNDPGHGWLRVPVGELEKLGIAENISKYSYMAYDWAFLEECVDAALFVDAMKANDSSWNLDDNVEEFTADEDSPIRDYEPYDYQAYLRELRNNMTVEASSIPQQ